MTTKLKLPTKKSLQKLLSEAAFNPREPGPMQVILETNNTEYFRLRAVELVKESLTLKPKQIHENLNLAIRLLLMTRATLTAETVDLPKPKGRGQSAPDAIPVSSTSARAGQRNDVMFDPRDEPGRNQ